MGGLASSGEGVDSTVRLLVDELAGNGSVAAVGLFGSWSRYGGSGAVDLLVVDRSGVDFEYREFLVRDEVGLDLDWIPWGWVGEVVSPEVDQRLRESVILYDPDGLLERARGFVSRNFRKPGRVEVRTEGYLTMAEMYLSRASSAYTRGDLGTAVLYADTSLMPLGYTLMDVAGIPITRGSFVWGLRRAGERLRRLDLYREILVGARLSKLSARGVRDLRGLFSGIWRGVVEFFMENWFVVEGLHDRLRRDISYLSDTALRGMVLARVDEMVGGHALVEATVYMRSWLLPLLEGYAWVVAVRRGDKFDYPSLLRVVGGSGEGNGVLDGSLLVLGLDSLEEVEVGRGIDGVRSLIERVRGDRRGLIRGFVG